MKTKEALSTGEVAKLLHLPRRTVSSYCASGRIPASQHPISKTWKIKRKDLIKFISESGLDTSGLMGPAKVLIVDDEPSVIGSITRVLANTGWKLSLDSATNGYDALVRIGAEVPELVILDVVMPGMNGKDILRSIKEGRQTKNTKILVVTGYPDRINEMMRLGADAALAKPFKNAELIEEVGRLLPNIAVLSKG